MFWFKWLFRKKKNNGKEREEYLKSFFEMQDESGNYLFQNKTENKILGYPVVMIGEEKAKIITDTKNKTGETKWYL
jgi:hypothetical protein